MLNILGMSPVVNGKLIVDPYIPFNFKAYDGVLVLPYRWRIGDFHKSLFELVIERETGIVYGAKLTLSGNHVLTNLPSGYEVATRKTGLPIIDASAFREDIWDEPCIFSLLHKNTEVYIVFNPSHNPDTCMMVNRAAFFGAEGVLCGVGFFQLTQEEITLLKKYFIP